MKKTFVRIFALLLVFCTAILPIGCFGATADSAFEPVVFQDSLSSETDTKTYTVQVDFSKAASFAFCAVRTGNTGINAVIKDKSGNVIYTLKADGATILYPTAGRIWYKLDKPANSQENVFTYTIEVSVKDTYTQNSNSFRLSVGNYEDLEKMLSGYENAVPVIKYTNYSDDGQTGGNWTRESFIPNNYGIWYKFTPYQDTVITIDSTSLDSDKLRFLIRNVDDTKVIYDSNNDSSSQRVSQISGVTFYIEKLKLSENPNIGLTYGKEYYLEVYTPENLRSPSTNFNGDFNIYIGEAHMMYGGGTFYSTDSITGTESYFSRSATIHVTGVPKTAVVYKIWTKGKISNTDIAQWRVKRSDESTWISSTPNKFGYPIKLPYNYGSSSNHRLLGDWQFSFKSSESSFTFTPGIRVEYCFELGD